MESTTKKLIANAIGTTSVFKQLQSFFVVVFSFRFRDELHREIYFPIPQTNKSKFINRILGVFQSYFIKTTIN